jgi:NADPH:quinone reductase-like Zn-dependent oxidoreductase
MYVYQIEGAFGTENIRRSEREVPELGDHDVLVEMRAASLNARDYLTVVGLYNPSQKLPLVPCSDGMGVVAAVGSAVDRFQEGDRVMPCFAQGWIDGPLTNAFKDITLGGPLDGTLCECMVVPQDGLVGVPASLGDLEASTLPCAALTAWNAVVNQGGVGAGDTVLIEGTGGVATFALQFAVMLGARSIVLSKSERKLETVTELGASETINYVREPDWSRRVKDLTNGVGADLVIELGGKATLGQAVRAVRASGRICLIGVLGGPLAELTLPLVVMRNVRLQGVTVGSRANFEAMINDIEREKIRPVIDRTFEIADISKAFDYLNAGKHLGKICLRHE